MDALDACCMLQYSALEPHTIVATSCEAVELEHPTALISLISIVTLPFTPSAQISIFSKFNLVAWSMQYSALSLQDLMGSPVASSQQSEKSSKLMFTVVKSSQLGWKLAL